MKSNNIKRQKTDFYRLMMDPATKEKYYLKCNGWKISVGDFDFAIAKKPIIDEQQIKGYFDIYDITLMGTGLLASNQGYNTIRRAIDDVVSYWYYRTEELYKQSDIIQKSAFKLDQYLKQFDK